MKFPANNRRMIRMQLLMVLLIAALMSVVGIWGWASSKVNAQAVQVVRDRIARLETNAQASQDIELVNFEYRQGFKGYHVHVTYNIVGAKNSQTQHRYFNITKPVFGGWYVAYDIDESTWNESMGAKIETLSLDQY